MGDPKPGLSDDERSAYEALRAVIWDTSVELDEALTAYCLRVGVRERFGLASDPGGDAERVEEIARLRNSLEARFGHLDPYITGRDPEVERRFCEQIDSTVPALGGPLPTAASESVHPEPVMAEASSRQAGDLVSAVHGLEIVAIPREAQLPHDLTTGLDCSRPPGAMPPSVERHLAREHVSAHWGRIPTDFECVDEPGAEDVCWRMTWEWPGDPEDEQERRRGAFRDALTVHGWSADAIENVWLHPHRYDMLELLRQRSPERVRAWEAAMQQAAEQVTSADGGQLGAAALQPRKRRFPELRAELCTARWEYGGRRIKLEDKERIKERLGRSPDKADAVVQAFWPHAVIELPDSFAIRTT